MVEQLHLKVEAASRRGRSFYLIAQKSLFNSERISKEARQRLELDLLNSVMPDVEITKQRKRQVID